MSDRTTRLERSAYCATTYENGDMVEWYEFSPESLEKYKRSIVEDCILELESNKECDPYTGGLFLSEKNDIIEFQITCLKDYFLGI